MTLLFFLNKNSSRTKRSTRPYLRDLLKGIKYEPNENNQKAIEKYGVIDRMKLGKFRRERDDIFIGNLVNEPDATVTVTLHQESSPKYVEFSIFSERNVGTNLFIWYNERGPQAVELIDEPFANGELDDVDGEIEDKEHVSQLT